jgi:hypothetical protein
MLPFDAYAVGCLVPIVFESYGRVLHPAWARDGSPVRWESVAAWSGRTAHSLVQFDRLTRPLNGDRVAAPPFERRPDDGPMPRNVLGPLCEALAAHTTTPEECFVGLWEGRRLLEPGVRTLRLGMPGQRLQLIFEGPLEAVHDNEWTNYDGTLVQEGPNCMWPADRAWFVASDVDQDSTYFGGSPRLLEALVADPRLEVWAARSTDPITWDSDAINPP